jgi:uncharacterized protein YggE
MSQRPGSLGSGSVDRELIVRGIGEVKTMPDLASVRVAVDGEGPSREEAYQAASTTAAAVDGVLADFGAAIDRVTTAALAVEPKTRWRKGEAQRTGWQALRVSVVEITDTSRVGELRQRAGEDARARAEQYAQALNIKLGPVAWAAEPGLRTVGYRITHDDSPSSHVGGNE